jgi:hypothetical protein
MTREDQVFVAYVMVIDSMWEMMALSAITRPIGAIVKVNAIAKIHKYRGLHERHHFVLMTMEVHDTPEHVMDHFIKEYARLFHNR